MERAHSPIEIRQAGTGDAPEIARLRVKLAVSGSRNLEPAVAAAYEARTSRFFRQALVRDDAFAWAAFDGSRMVGVAVLLLHLSAPRLTSSDSVRGVPLDARIRNVFVESVYRRRGVARLLMRAAMEHARALGCYRVTLGSSDMGVPLYESLGFKPMPREMEYVF